MLRVQTILVAAGAEGHQGRGLPGQDQGQGGRVGQGRQGQTSQCRGENLGLEILTVSRQFSIFFHIYIASETLSELGESSLKN